MRTKAEINKEVAALKALVPTGRWAAKTKEMLGYTIEELEHGVDQSAEEWDELGDDAQQSVLDAEHWKNGYSDDKPSKSFTGLVK